MARTTDEAGPAQALWLAVILDLEPAGDTVFIGHSPPDRERRVFGGQVVAQALVAANRTISDRTAHSLHAYFLLPGDPKQPIRYEVEALRDGKSFSTRRVVAHQSSGAIYAMSVSYQKAEQGLEHQFEMPSVPLPEVLPDGAEIVRLYSDRLPLPLVKWLSTPQRIDVRMCSIQRYFSVGQSPAQPSATENVWMRVAHALPDDPAIHQAGLAYLSDNWILDTTLVAHGRWLGDADIMPASLDHAIWFHRPARADQWLLFAQESPTTVGARGFGRGLVYTEAGVLVASFAQEGLIRLRTG